jgi:hypothetical protein
MIRVQKLRTITRMTNGHNGHRGTQRQRRGLDGLETANKEQGSICVSNPRCVFFTFFKFLLLPTYD